MSIEFSFGFIFCLVLNLDSVQTSVQQWISLVRCAVYFKVTVVLVSNKRWSTDAVTFRSSLLFQILWEQHLLEVYVKCMGMLGRFSFSNYRKKAERILEQYFFTDFQFVAWLLKTHNWCSYSETHAILWDQQNSFFFCVCLSPCQFHVVFVNAYPGQKLLHFHETLIFLK